MIYLQLQKKHPKFIYENFSYFFGKAGLACKFQLKLEPDIVFRPEILIVGAKKNAISKISKETLENFVFHLGLAEIPSYWKCAVSPKIEIRAAKINKEQAVWWKNLFMKGLAEFFYVNNINTKKAAPKIYSTGKKSFMAHAGSKKIQPQKFLVLVGGGKDSLVALKLMQAARKNIGTMVLGGVKASHDLIKSCGLKKPISIERKIDKKLLELNKKGYLNGHTPFSSYLAFLGVFCAELFGYDSVVAANERSANEPTVVLGKQKINHQYSKSYEFEKSFREYIKKYLTKDIDYFSVLRPLYELQIAKLASRYPKNLIATKSCNIGMKKNIWCGKCSKCLSVYLLFYPFLGSEKLQKLFHKNLFEDRKLWKYTTKLLEEKNNKPFECVATRKENMVALALAEKAADGRKPYILKKFSGAYGVRTIDVAEIEKIMRAWDSKNFLPAYIKNVLKNIIATTF